MGFVDRVKAMFGGGGAADDVGLVEPPPVDRDARRPQLDELENALRALARAMAADDAKMTNPGWKGRVEDLRFAANEASALSRTEFGRAELMDVVAEVRLLYGPGDVPPEYAPLESEHDRVTAAVAALRAPLASESPPT